MCMMNVVLISEKKKKKKFSNENKTITHQQVLDLVWNN